MTQVIIPIEVKVIEQQEVAKAALKDLSCPDNKELLKDLFAKSVEESGVK